MDSTSQSQIFSWSRISSVQVHIDLQADSLPEGAHLQERLDPHHPQLRRWHPPPHPPLLPEQGRPFHKSCYPG